MIEELGKGFLGMWNPKCWSMELYKKPSIIRKDGKVQCLRTAHDQPNYGLTKCTHQTSYSTADSSWAGPGLRAHPGLPEDKQVRIGLYYLRNVLPLVLPKHQPTGCLGPLHPLRFKLNFPWWETSIPPPSLRFLPGTTVSYSLLLGLRSSSPFARYHLANPNPT